MNSSLDNAAPLRFGLIVGVLVLGLAGCAPIAAIRPLPAVDGSSAEVVIYRKWGFVNGGAPFAVKVDKVVVGSLKNDEFVKFRLVPGIHTVELSLGGSLGLALVQVGPGSQHCFTYHMPLSAPTEANDLVPTPCAEVLKMVEGKRGVTLN